MDNPTILRRHGGTVIVNIDELSETPDFDLVGNLPEYHHFKEEIDPSLWNRLEMIRIWENHFIHGIEVEDTLPSFDFDKYEVVRLVECELEGLRDFNRSMWSTELSYLQHINEAALQPAFRPNCQTSFLYMTYYMKIRRKVLKETEGRHMAQLSIAGKR